MMKIISQMSIELNNALAPKHVILKLKINMIMMNVELMSIAHLSNKIVENLQKDAFCLNFVALLVHGEIIW